MERYRQQEWTTQVNLHALEKCTLWGMCAR